MSAFDEVIDRRHTNSIKWARQQLLTPAQCAAHPLPMWVADMDFRAPRPVIDALHTAIEHGVFGYPCSSTPGYVAAVVDWQRRRFGWQVDPAWLVPTSGVVTTLKCAIQAFSAPGDSVLVQPPVYGHFHGDVLINDRRLAYAPLERTETGYSFDPAAFEAAIRDDTRIFILSHPHNPTGNVWSEEELRTMGVICQRHGLTVISDEIHQDLVLNPDKRHIPFASLGEAFAQSSITCTAPSKTFNLPGMQCANILVPNPQLRERLIRQIDRNMASLVNPLGMAAAEAAYRHGEPWLEELLAYLRINQSHFARSVNEATTKLRVLPADALYLAWIDCRGLGMDPDALNEFMLTKAGLWLDKGQKFGLEGYGYMRINLGCPRTTVDEAIERLLRAVR